MVLIMLDKEGSKEINSEGKTEDPFVVVLKTETFLCFPLFLRYHRS